MKYILWVALAGLLFSCDSKSEENLPPASGRSGDVYLVMDSSQWKGALGKQLDSIFSTEMLVLNRIEPIFKMRWIDARKLNYTLKLRRNLIFAVTLDQNTEGANRIKGMLTAESIAKIKSDTAFFFKSVKNQFAKGQESFFLVGTTRAALLKKIQQNSSQLVALLEKSEQERLTTQLFKSGQQKGISEMIKKRWGVELKIPFGYELVQENQEFLWVRQFNQKDDRDIFISRKPYIDKNQFERDSLLAFRNAICQKYLFGDPEKPNSYLTTETNVPSKRARVHNTTLGGQFAVQMRGLWRTNNLSMGGAFISYTVADPKQSMLYYIEGFVYAPGREQREIIRELETILNTFKISG